LADKRRLPSAQAATIDQIHQAVIALTSVELKRLRQFAKYRLEAIGRANEEKDLVQAAITRTIDGQRSWNKNNVDFFGHLLGVISSMTSHTPVQPADKTEADMIKTGEDGDTASPLATAATGLPDAHRSLHAKERVEGLEQYFKDEPLILLVIDGLKDRMTVPEIASGLGVTQNDIETALRKIRRHRKNIATEGRAHG
jgi:ParB-like chromosome segregation protein Spo0J